MNRNYLDKLKKHDSTGYLWKKYNEMTIRERINFRKDMFGIFGYTFPQTNNEEGC
jgi:hypothetical protein